MKLLIRNYIGMGELVESICRWICVILVVFYVVFRGKRLLKGYWVKLRIFIYFLEEFFIVFGKFGLVLDLMFDDDFFVIS